MPKLNWAGRKYSRNENTKTVSPGNYLIVTEGTETEVNYFKRIKEIIEGLFRNEIIVDEYEKSKIFSPAKMDPCTKVQDLVEELVEYIKPQIK